MPEQMWIGGVTMTLYQSYQVLQSTHGPSISITAPSPCLCPSS